MKKIFILLIMLFFLTSCNVKYNLTYENGSFKENLNVTQEKSKSDNTVDDLKSFYETNKNNSDYNLFYNLSGNIEELIFKKESKNIIDSKVLDCFSKKVILDEKDTYYFYLPYEDISCNYLTEVEFVFKTDSKVIKSNATFKDERNGIYKWNTIENGIELLFSKEKNKVNNNINYVRYIVFILIIVSAFIFIIYRYKKDNRI